MSTGGSPPGWLSSAPASTSTPAGTDLVAAQDVADARCAAIARSAAFQAARLVVPLLTPALYDTLLTLDRWPPEQMARQLRLSLRDSERCLGQALPRALRLAPPDGLTLTQQARYLLAAAARHRIVAPVRADDERWWCRRQTAQRPEATGGVPWQPNPSQIERAQWLVNDLLVASQQVERRETQRRYERAREAPVVVERKTGP